MSSSTYSTCLTPDRQLRGLLRVSASLLGLLGVGIIVLSDLPGALQFVLLLFWGAEIGRQRCVLRRSQWNCSVIRLSNDGTLRVKDRLGEWRLAELMPGSIVLRQIAWLRYRDHAGQTNVELLRGNSLECQQWRRLQVIWRFIGAAT